MPILIHTCPILGQVLARIVDNPKQFASDIAEIFIYC